MRLPSLNGIVWFSSSLLIFLACYAIVSGEASTTPTYVSLYCSPSFSQPTTTTYRSNLVSLFSSLVSNSTLPSSSGFHSTFAGSGHDNQMAYGSFLCRGDVTTNICEKCVTSATANLTRSCTKEWTALIWYEECTVRYSNAPVKQLVIGESYFTVVENQTVDDDSEFSEILGRTLSGLSDEISSRLSEGRHGRKLFGTKEVNMKQLYNLAVLGRCLRKCFKEINFTIIEIVFGSQVGWHRLMIYTLGQCAPDLEAVDCGRCLEWSIAQFESCCKERQGGSVYGGSCNVRYEIFPFYDVRGLKPTTEFKAKGGMTAGTIVVAAIVVGVALLGIISLLYYFFLFRKRKEKHETVIGWEDVQSLQYKLWTIRSATNNFSDANKLDQGDSGHIYQGVLSNGTHIAVKRLPTVPGSGSVAFRKRIVSESKLQHRNLVTLLGFCIKGAEQILIYEFLPNKSLDFFLFDYEKQGLLDWHCRYKIIQGIARGLLYLHEDTEQRIIHRNLKASNVLLDETMNPKISGLSMARTVDMDDSGGDTSKIAGTRGYVAPECAMHGLFSVKSDVYSFGVMVLEIVSGKRNNQPDGTSDLLSNAWQCWHEQEQLTPLNFVDPCLKGACILREVDRCIHVGLLCVQEDPSVRPTMEIISLGLSSDSISLPQPQQPPIVYQRGSSVLELIKESTDPLTHSCSSINERRHAALTIGASATQSLDESCSVNQASFTELYHR